jgi:hypothetical protein
MSMISQAFPTITHLTYTGDCIHRIVGLQHIDAHSGSRVKCWPHLWTIALPTATKDDAARILEFIIWRKAMGHPIQKLLVPELVVGNEPMTYRCLQEYVQVEVFNDNIQVDRCRTLDLLRPQQPFEHLLVDSHLY